MKKLLLTVFMLVMALALVACGGGKGKAISDVSGAKKVYDDTVEEYKNANSVDAKFTYKNGTETQTITFAYVLDGAIIKQLAYVSNGKNGELSVYVKDGVAYMNAYGVKTQAQITDEDNANFKENFSFASAMDEVNNLFGYTFFTAASLEDANGETVKLSCDLSKLEANPELGEDEFFDMEENIEKLQAKKALNVEFNYKDGKMTKFVGTVTEQDDSKKVFTIEFNGTNASITFPELTGYEQAK